MKRFITLFLLIPFGLTAGYFDGIPQEIAAKVVADAEKNYPESYSSQEGYISMKLKYYRKMLEIKKEINK